MKIRKHCKLVFVLFYIMITTFCLCTFLSSARYRTTYNANFNVNLAKWTLKVGKGTDTRENFSINLAEHQKSVNPTFENTNIAPGSKGSFIVELDCTDTEVGVEYEFSISKDSSYNIPSNIKFECATNDNQKINLLENVYRSSISLEEIKENPKRNIIISWEWVYDEEVDESTYEGQDIAFKLDVLVFQNYE